MGLLEIKISNVGSGKTSEVHMKNKSRVYIILVANHTICYNIKIV